MVFTNQPEAMQSKDSEVFHQTNAHCMDNFPGFFTKISGRIIASIITNFFTQ